MMLSLVAFAAFCATFLGGLFALRLKDRLHLILGFSAGAVLGVAFFDLLPEAVNLAGSAYAPSLVFTLVALGFVAYLILDRIFFFHGHGGCDEHTDVVCKRGALGAGSLSAHSFLDGLAIGLAFKVSPSVGLVVALAVVAHDFSDGINTVSMVLKNGGARERAFRWLALDALAPALGVIAAYFLDVRAERLGLFVALFAGFFLYIGASDLLPESHHAHPMRWTTVATLLGMAVLYGAIQLAGI